MNLSFQQIIISIVIVLIPMVLSLTVHEWAHAFAAKRLGDDTAERLGRLTLSPDKHIDLLGSIVFPIIGVFFGFLFGWAKPVPFEPSRFRRGISIKRGTLIVAAAGPLSNLIAALLCALALKAMLTFGDGGFLPGAWGEPFARLAGAGLHLNVVLAIFNLVPVSPLDGSKILYGLLPARLDYVVDWLERHRMIVFLIFLFAGAGVISRFVIYPVLTLIVVATGLGDGLEFLNLRPVL